jgi:hypothetical protein
MRTFTGHPPSQGNPFEESRLELYKGFGDRLEFFYSLRLEYLPRSPICILAACALSYKRSDSGTRLVVGFDLPDLSTVGIRSSSGI